MMLKIMQQIIEMFDKIQMILMMKTTISNNRISRLKNRKGRHERDIKTTQRQTNQIC